MDTSRKYLAGDIHSLKAVDRIVPRTLELPMLLQSKIQIRKNLFDIKSKLQHHLEAYDYKFKSLATEPKQVIRALRPRLDDARKLSPRKFTSADRSLMKESSWKLPPNVYRLKDAFEVTSKRQMGKLGPYRCFTVERDDKTVIGHHNARSNFDCETDFYELPSSMNLTTTNPHKSEFLKGDRFPVRTLQSGPCPTKYFPQNFTIKSHPAGKTTSFEPSVFFYPNTTVPETLRIFYKPTSCSLPPGRYYNHNVPSCSIRRLSKASSDRHKQASNMSMEISSNKLEMPSVSINEQTPTGHLSDSVRQKLLAEASQTAVKDDIRFNTMIEKRNLFPVKTGRPVGFLVASPRFPDHEPTLKKVQRPQRRSTLVQVIRKPHSKMTKERLEELASPKNPLPRIPFLSPQIFKSLPAPIGMAEAFESPAAGISDIDLQELRVTNEAAVGNINETSA